MTDFGFKGTRPEHWVCRHGAPSAVGCGMPSFESEDGKLVVYDFVVAQVMREQIMLFSRWYGFASLLAPDSMVPLHHSPDAWWSWRPVLWRLNAFFGWQALGSQQELNWRFGLMEMQHAVHAGADFTFPDANAKALELLRSTLTPQQKIELSAYGWFRLRGAATGNLYEVELGNGFAIIDPRTLAPVVSYCLHTEEWLPDADQALAVKLALEDRDLEIECLENARMYVKDGGGRPTRDDVIAADFERELIHRRRELIAA